MHVVLKHSLALNMRQAHVNATCWTQQIRVQTFLFPAAISEILLVRGMRGFYLLCLLAAGADAAAAAVIPQSNSHAWGAVSMRNLQYIQSGVGWFVPVVGKYRLNWSASSCVLCV